MNPLISYKLYNSLNCTLEGWVPLAVVGGAFSSFYPILLPILHIININIYQSPDPGWGKGGGLIKNYPNLYQTQMNIDRNPDSKKPGYIYLSTVSPPGWLHDLPPRVPRLSKIDPQSQYILLLCRVMENIANTQSSVDSHMTTRKTSDSST